jgi:putative glutamine amidotransferase
MSKNVSSPRIGVYGGEATGNQPRGGVGLWAPGYKAALVAAEATPVPLQMRPGCSWDELLESVEGVVFAECDPGATRHQAEEERLCEWCRELGLPFLGVDEGLHVLNTTFGGTIHLDIARELPDALQHRQPPEPGVRHAIAVTEGTRMARIFGEGEIVVNSEHRQAVNRVARGFRVSARALDGVIEAIETVEGEVGNWFALGVQWHPASASASGLDIQLFRSLVEACTRRHHHRRGRTAQTVAA